MHHSNNIMSMVGCINFCRLEFPFVLVLYQDIIISLHGVIVLTGFADRHLFCTSKDLIETLNSPASPFCTISGIEYSISSPVIICLHVTSL